MQLADLPVNVYGVAERILQSLFAKQPDAGGFERGERHVSVQDRESFGVVVECARLGSG